MGVYSTIINMVYLKVMSFWVFGSHPKLEPWPKKGSVKIMLFKKGGANGLPCLLKDQNPDPIP